MGSISISHTGDTFEAHVTIAGSKSLSNRVLILQHLLKKNNCNFEISNISDATDTHLLQEALQKIESATSSTSIDFVKIFVGNAGTTFRFLTALLSFTPGKWLLEGDEAMQQRPIASLVETLKELGAQIEYQNTDGFPNLQITGIPIPQKNTCIIDASKSSQYVSALLLLAPILPVGFELNILNHTVSKSYIEQTIALLKIIGITIKYSDKQLIITDKKFLNSCKYLVEPDWSSVAFMYELIAFSNDATIIIENIAEQSLQGDAIISSIASQMGLLSEWYVKDSISNLKISCIPNFNLPEKIQLDLSATPDLLQPVLCIAAFKNLPITIYGIGHTIYKETNRILALQTELAKCNIKIEIINNDTIQISNNNFSLASNTLFKTYQDHRMAMCLAPMALSGKTILLDDAAVVDKSFPDFWNVLRKLNFKINHI